MTVQRDRDTELRTRTTPTEPAWWNTTEWILGIVGAVALFLGLFISFAGEDQSLGFGGDWSWEVGEISSAWQYGFLIGGAVLLIAAIGMALQARRR